VVDLFFTEPKNIADAFANNFKTIFNTSCPTFVSPYTVTTDFFPTAPISAAEYFKERENVQVSWTRLRAGKPVAIFATSCKNKEIRLIN
jgi:hypothetical protein